MLHKKKKSILALQRMSSGSLSLLAVQQRIFLYLLPYGRRVTRLWQGRVAKLVCKILDIHFDTFMASTELPQYYRLSRHVFSFDTKFQHLRHAEKNTKLRPVMWLTGCMCNVIFYKN